MVGPIKLTGFRGVAPKVSPELIPDQMAQVARNCKLYSGDIIPYPEPLNVGNHGLNAPVRTLFALRNPVTNEPVWLAWSDDVNIARPSFSGNGDQRFYYTGDGKPKVSNYALATTGLAPYPVDYYELGLPLPETKVTATPTAFSQKTTSSIARDASSTATIVTSAAHGLRTGNIVTISGLTERTGTYSFDGTATNPITVTLANHGFVTGATVYIDFTNNIDTNGNAVVPDGSYTITVTGTNTFTIPNRAGIASATRTGNAGIDISTFNGTNVEVTVVDATTFTYFNPGPQMSTYSVATGRVDLAGNPTLRTYVYTWYTPWSEESIASEPSSDIFVKEGQTVTITNIPTVKPSEPIKNFVSGVRLYRTFESDQAGEYFLLKTLWFPHAPATVSRTSNVSRVKMQRQHNFIEGDRFKLTGCTDTSFNITDGEVLELIDEFTFTYSQVGSNKSETADTTGTLYYDVSEDNDKPARYWGDGGYSFIDDFDTSALVEALESDEYAPPPKDLQGLIAINSDTLVGFVGNRLYFSEPGKPHAWPEEYEITLEHDIVAVAPLSALGLVVMTEAYPYLLSGSDPAVLTPQRIDALYPCLSSRGVVSMNFGVLYPTHEGLALISGSSLPRIATAALFNQDTWADLLDPASIVATYYGDMYFGSHATGSFVFMPEDNTPGMFVNCDDTFDAPWYDTLTNRLYYASGTAGDVYEWDNVSQPNQSITWKSKVFVTQDYMNPGAARVIADYGGQAYTFNNADVDFNDAAFAFNSPIPVRFKLWADKTLVMDTTVVSGLIFRLPTGYKSDTYEFEVQGNVRIRAIHIGPTPTSLKGV